MDYLQKILDKGVVISVNLGHHKLNTRYLSKLRQDEKSEIEKLYALCEDLTNEYYRLTKENQKIFEQINQEFIKLLDQQINLNENAPIGEFKKIEQQMHQLEKKYKKLEQTVGLDLIKNEITDCIERINMYFMQVENIIAQSLPQKNPCY